MLIQVIEMASRKRDEEDKNGEHKNKVTDIVGYGWQGGREKIPQLVKQFQSFDREENKQINYWPKIITFEIGKIILPSVLNCILL